MDPALIAADTVRSAADGWRAFRHGVALFLALTAGVWCAGMALHRWLPFVHNGAAVVAGDKRLTAASRPLFDATACVRVLAFGDSRMLAGLSPTAFTAAYDRDAGTGASTGVGVGASVFNLAIPGEARYLDLLDTVLSRPDAPAPTLLLVQTLPPLQPAATWRQSLTDDKSIIETLLPFRSLPRDGAVFLFEALRGGGPRAQYRDNALQIERMRADRGHYFIRSQSHYAGDRLPPGFVLPTDALGTPERRPVDVQAPDFRRLAALAQSQGFEVLLVPAPIRIGEKALPPPLDREAVAALRDQRHVHALGPASLNYGVELFSDPVHLNREGAARYSADLAALVRAWEAGRAAADAGRVCPAATGPR